MSSTGCSSRSAKRFNPALEAAIASANRLNLPLVVGFGLTDGYPQANARHYAFMLQGLRERGCCAHAARHSLRSCAAVSRRRRDRISPSAPRWSSATAAICVIRSNGATRSHGRSKCRVLQVEGDVGRAGRARLAKSARLARAPCGRRSCACATIFYGRCGARRRCTKRRRTGLRSAALARLVRPACTSRSASRSIARSRPFGAFRGGHEEAKRRLDGSWDGRSAKLRSSTSRARERAGVVSRRISALRPDFAGRDRARRAQCRRRATPIVPPTSKS